MAARKQQDVPLTAAQSKRVHDSATKLISHAVDLLASGQTISPEMFTSAAIPILGGPGRTMMEAQKFRANWYSIDRKVLTRIARLVIQRNWFARPVHTLNKKIHGAGFRFNSPEAREWVKQGDYPFKRVHDDLLDEYLVASSVVAFWRKQAEPGKLPTIEIPDMEDVDYEVIGGVPQITVTVRRNGKISDELKPIIGDKMWNCIKLGKRLVIVEGLESDEYEFRILKSGKSTAAIEAPEITGILDDLDFIEAIRVGDWNGAWARREIIRHTKKGYGVSSGPNAGTARNNAKYAEIQAILKAMKGILGKTDVATNFDQEIAWLTFPKDFFASEMIQPAYQRLIFWGGLSAILLLKTDSQITGLSGFLHDRVRTQVEGFRADFGTFLSSIFNSPSFRTNIPSAPPLVPMWSVKPLYTGDALVKYATWAATYAGLSPQSVRDLFDIDDTAESALMLKAHENRQAYTPPFEPRQGLIQSLFPEDFADGSTGTGESGLPGSPGRPTADA